MKVGDPLQFLLTLWDFAEDLFIQAVVYADGVELPFSPVTIPHKENGTYYLKDGTTYKFPIYANEVAIVYRVFRDNGFTELSVSHSPADEKYFLDKAPVSGELDDKLDKIIDIVSSHGLTTQVIGYIDDDNEPINGYVVIEDIIGYVDDHGALIGYVVDEEAVNGEISDDDMVGFFDL